MKLIRMFCALAMALCASAAQATVFDFSYTFGSGDVVTGSLTGTQSGQYVTGVSNVSVYLNGNPFTGNGNLYQPYYFQAGCCFVGGAGIVSFDGILNNFYFSDAAPNTPSTNVFYINGTDTASSTPNALHYARVITQTSSTIDISADIPNYPGVNGFFDAAKWSLTEHVAVPAPASAALLLLGLAGLLSRSGRARGARSPSWRR